MRSHHMSAAYCPFATNLSPLPNHYERLHSIMALPSNFNSLSPAQQLDEYRKENELLNAKVATKAPGRSNKPSLKYNA